MFTSFIIASNNIYYIRIIRNKNIRRRKIMKKLKLCYVGKAKDFNVKSIIRYSYCKLTSKCFKFVKGE